MENDPDNLDDVQCNCGALLTNAPHAESCPVTAYVRQRARQEAPLQILGSTEVGFVEGLVARWLRNRGASMDPATYAAAVGLATYAYMEGIKKARATESPISSRLRGLARQALAARDNDKRTDEQKIDDAVDFICDTRMDPKVEQVVRFCPECGHLGPVPEDNRDCCPDGGHAGMIPIRLAERCAQLFKDSLAGPDPEQLQAEFHRRIKPKFSKRQQGILMGEFRDVLKGNKQ